MVYRIYNFRVTHASTCSSSGYCANCVGWDTSDSHPCTYNGMTLGDCGTCGSSVCNPAYSSGIATSMLISCPETVPPPSPPAPPSPPPVPYMYSVYRTSKFCNENPSTSWMPGHTAESCALFAEHTRITSAWGASEIFFALKTDGQCKVTLTCNNQWTDSNTNVYRMNQFLNAIPSSCGSGHSGSYCSSCAGYDAADAHPCTYSGMTPGDCGKCAGNTCNAAYSGGVANSNLISCPFTVSPPAPPSPPPAPPYKSVYNHVSRYCNDGGSWVSGHTESSCNDLAYSSKPGWATQMWASFNSGNGQCRVTTACNNPWYQSNTIATRLYDFT